MTATTTRIPTAQADRFGHGVTVATMERNGANDSDFSAIVAVPLPEGGFGFRHETTGSTAYAGGFIAVEDATEEVLEAYRAKRQEVLGGLAEERRALEAAEVKPGAQVVVVKAVTRGKNRVAAGEFAEVTWKGVDSFKSDRWGTVYRVGLALGDGRKVFVAEENVRVVGFEDQDLPDLDRTVDYLVARSWPLR